MIHRDILRQQAHDDCLKHIETLLNGDFMVELGPSEVQWSPVELRQVFEQQMVLWRRYGTFDVILDAEGRPVGFVDESQWLDCAWAPLDYNEVIGIVRVASLELPKLVIETMEPGEKDCLAVVLKQVPEGETPVRWLARINPVRRTLIAIEPIVADHDGTGS